MHTYIYIYTHTQSGDYPNYSIFKISKITEKSNGDLERFAVTQTLLEDHHLAFVCGTLIGVSAIIIIIIIV